MASSDGSSYYSTDTRETQISYQSAPADELLYPPLSSLMRAACSSGTEEIIPGSEETGPGTEDVTPGSEEDCEYPAYLEVVEELGHESGLVVTDDKGLEILDLNDCREVVPGECLIRPAPDVIDPRSMMGARQLECTRLGRIVRSQCYEMLIDLLSKVKREPLVFKALSLNCSILNNQDRINMGNLESVINLRKRQTLGVHGTNVSIKDCDEFVSELSRYYGYYMAYKFKLKMQKKCLGNALKDDGVYYVY